MKVYTLKKQQFIRKPVHDVFSFFSRPENLAVITPKDLGFTILTPSPILMKEGVVIDYIIRLARLPVRWKTLISRYDPPRCFVDEQLKGPYALWHHTHSFEPMNNGTLIVDEVRYTIPFGVVGRVVHALFVRRQLEAIFSHRATIIQKLFSSSTPTKESATLSLKEETI